MNTMCSHFYYISHPKPDEANKNIRTLASKDYKKSGAVLCCEESVLALVPIPNALFQFGGGVLSSFSHNSLDFRIAMHICLFVQ